MCVPTTNPMSCKRYKVKLGEDLCWRWRRGGRGRSRVVIVTVIAVVIATVTAVVVVIVTTPPLAVTTDQEAPTMSLLSVLRCLTSSGLSAPRSGVARVCLLVAILCVGCDSGVPF